MIEVEATAHEVFEVPASPGQVFEVLANVPDSSAHFPNVESLTPEEGGYTWRLAKTGLGKVSLQVVYASRYESDPEQLTVRWTPIEGIGNSSSQGNWLIEAHPGGSRVTLHNKLTVTLGIPRVLRKVAQTLISRENTRLVRGYLENLSKSFSGGNGRLR